MTNADRVVKAAVTWVKAEDAFSKSLTKKNTWRSIYAEDALREAVRAYLRKTHGVILCRKK